MSDSGVLVMAVFRPDAALLRRQLESLKLQTLRDWRCLVGIDGADAATRSLLEELIGEDARFRLIEYPENVGHYRNFERLTAEARSTGEWLALCDQDDYWYPDKLERLVSVIREDPATAAVVGAARVVDRDGNVLSVTRRKPASCSDLLLKNEVTGSLSIFRPDVLDLALPFPDPTRAAVHDHWLGVCAAALGRVSVSYEPVQDYVQHDANVVGEATRSKNLARLRATAGNGTLRQRMDSLSYELWGWRVSMARTLLSRLGKPQSGLSEAILPVAEAHMSVGLARRLTAATLTRHLSPTKAITMAAAAVWWPHVATAQPDCAGRQSDR